MSDITTSSRELRLTAGGGAKLEMMLREFAAIGGAVDARPFRNFHNFVLAYGRPFKAGPYPERLTRYARPQKMGFRNAYRLVRAFPDELRYVEGFATHPYCMDFLALHGWAVDKTGTVVDPKWMNAGIEYFGVAFDIGYVQRIMGDGKGHMNSVLDNYRERWPLLDGRHDDWMPKKAG